MREFKMITLAQAKLELILAKENHSLWLRYYNSSGNSEYIELARKEVCSMRYYRKKINEIESSVLVK